MRVERDEQGVAGRRWLRHLLLLWLAGGLLHVMAAAGPGVASDWKRDRRAEGFEKAMRQVESHLVALEAEGKGQRRQLKVWRSEDGGRVYMVEVDGPTKRLGWMPTDLICGDR